MKVMDEFLNGVQLLEVPRFEDQRGRFTVLHQDESAAAAGIATRFVQDNVSVSTAAGTVRGLHLQIDPWAQGKLVQVIGGTIFDVVVDLRPGSSTRGEHRSTEISSKLPAALWVPPGFAHGFCTLEPDTEVFYKVDAPYQPSAEWTLAWDDPELAIEWPVGGAEVVLSAKDRLGTSLAETMQAIDQATTEMTQPDDAGSDDFGGGSTGV